MFKKLFGRKSVPTNSGELSDDPVLPRHKWVKVFEIELSNMEGAPVYGLTHQLSIGSEIGNVVINDPSISPRHCTFILQQEVVSVIDHASMSGVIVNGKKIPSGKYIILEETDIIAIGALEIRLIIKTESVPEDVIPDIPVEEEEPEEVHEEVVEEVIEEEIEEEEETPKISAHKKGMKNPLAAVTKLKTPYATNALVRVIAVVADLLLAYSLFVVFSPFDEFRAFLNFLPDTLADLLDVNWENLWQAFIQDNGFIGEMTQDLFKFMSSTFHFGPIFLMFVMVRLVSTLIWGVSISEFILGVKAHGNAIWKRVGGVLRVLLGVITGPFLIFDVPAVVSRRTLKEFMSFTHTYLDSKFVAILSTLLYVPLLLALALVSPLFQGLEVPEPILVNDKIERRVKAVQDEGTVEVVSIQESSRFLNLSIRYNAKELDIIPTVKFYGVQNKQNYRPRAVFYHKDLQRSVQLEVYKTFDMKQLLGIGMKGNFFLYDQYPEIYSFVFGGVDGNPAFKVEKGEKVENKFANEFISFTKMALELDASKSVEIMQSSTPLVKGLMDFRSSFLSLLEYKDFDQIGFIKIGNVTFLKVSYLKQKPFDLIIPLIRGEGRIFKINFDKKENLGALSSKFYKYSLNESDWLPESYPVMGEAMTSLEALDFFSSQLNKQEISPLRAQALYGYYYEQSAKILSQLDAFEYELWVDSVEAVFKVMEKMMQTRTEAPSEEGVVDPRAKLFQNFRDLKDAMDSKNKEYFGLEQNVTL